MSSRPTIRLVHTEFLAALTELRAIAAELRDGQRTAERSVAVLLDGGWSGAAAREFDEGFDRWRRGCSEVLAGLEVMSDLLRLARVDLVARDEVVAGVLGGPSGGGA